jgi:hypothetical protein
MRGLALSALMLTPAILSAADLQRARLSTDCEVSVALSAAPSRLRADASVYALQEGDYRKVVEGEGPLTCIVERNHPDSVIPQCMDKAGIDSVLPAIIARSRMTLGGASFTEVQAENTKKLENGDYAGASRPGVSYMMSAYNYIFVESSNGIRKVPPHVMFYAPNVTNADIGGSFESMVNNIGTPVLFNEGPHGYMVVYTQYPASPDDVAENCRGQLGEPPPVFDPFPKG